MSLLRHRKKEVHRPSRAARRCTAYILAGGVEQAEERARRVKRMFDELVSDQFGLGKYDVNSRAKKRKRVAVRAARKANR